MEKVNSYNDYRELLNGRGDVFVFRGQAFSDYVLIPSSLRGEHVKEADKQMFKFVDEMQKIFGFDELTCMEIAQHFFLPTRMLDFSYSYDVALFFACHDRHENHIEHDGKVYVFNKSKYERILKEKNKLSGQVVRSNKFLYEWLQKFIDKKSTLVGKEGIDLPIFVDATEEFDRLYMQKGLFLLWGKDESNFEKIIEKENIDIHDFLEEIIIKKECKKDILNELLKKNISEDTLYMNADRIKGLVSLIKESK